MKRIIISTLFITLMSCGPSHPLNYVHIQVGNDSTKVCYVVGMADSTLEVLNENSAHASLDRIPLSKISRLSIQRNTTPYGWIGGLSACTATAAGILIYEKANGIKGDGGEGIVAEVAFPVGAFLGCNLSDGMQELDLGNPDSRNLLLNRSLDARGTW